MARRADGSFRHATENAASTSDEIDAGWDEAPTQITLPPRSTARVAVPESAIGALRTVSTLPKPTLTSSPPPTLRSFPPASEARKVSGVHLLSASLPPVATAPRPNPSGRVPRALTPPLSWLDRAALLQEQLGIGERASPSVRAKPASVRQEPALIREEPARHEPAPEEPTLAREEPTLVREEPTLIREEPTLAREEPTLQFSTASLAVATFSVSEVALDEAALNIDAEVAEQVRDDELFSEESGQRLHETAAVPSETSQHSDSEIPNFRRHQVGPALIVAAMAVAAALLVGSVVSHQFASHPVSTAATSTPEVAKETPQPLPIPPSPEPDPAASPTPPANAALAPHTAPASTSPETTPPALVVTVKVIPTAAVIFRAGEKLGASEIQVRVEHDAKLRLTALHDGYSPYNFTLDGSRDTVTVRLKHAPRPRPATTPVSDSPFESTNQDSNGVKPEPTPAAPAPESAPAAAPSPAPPAGDAPAE